VLTPFGVTNMAGLLSVVNDITGMLQRDGATTGQGAEQPQEQDDGQLESGPANRVAKRPRYNDKAFNDITIGDVESMTKEVMELRRKCAKQQEELTSLQNVKTEKAAMFKQNRELQAQVDSVKKEADKLKGAYKEQAVDKPEKQADEVKKVIEKNIRFQMTYEAAFMERLQGDGREVQTCVPNVSYEALKILGIDRCETQTKYADCFFGGPITKVVQGRPRIVLKRDLSFKYFVTTGELRIEGRYAFENAKKQAKKGGKRKSGAEAPEEEDEGEGDADVDNTETDSSAQAKLPLSTS